MSTLLPDLLATARQVYTREAAATAEKAFLLRLRRQ